MGKKNLTVAQKYEVLVCLLQDSIEGKPRHGRMKEASERFGLDRKTIFVLWKQSKASISQGHLDMKSNKAGHQRHKEILPNLEQIKGLQKSERSTMRCLSEAVGVSTSLVHKWVSKGYLRPHTSALKPSLSDGNKIERLNFSMRELEFDKVEGKVMFKDMTQTIHIDEKWFYISKDGVKYYLTPDEDEVYRAVQSKNHVIKVMFMCAVSKPMYNEDGSLLFDGEIGIFPFTYEQPAQRSSKNKAAGTLETKTITSVTRAVTKECLINQILPAIKSKWPQSRSKHINIQQDNAKPHIKDSDLDFRQAASADGFHIRLVQQPPNSSDMNANDLGFFRSLQATESKNPSRTTIALVESVNKAFLEYNAYKLKCIFLSLQSVLIEVLKHKGHNDFKLPHMEKECLQRQELLPDNLIGDEGLVRSCIEYLVTIGKVEGLEKLMDGMGYMRV